MERSNKEEVWKKAKELGKEEIFKGQKAKVSYNKLRIEGEEWIWRERERQWVQKPKEEHQEDSVEVDELTEGVGTDQIVVVE